ncbi:MAG: hypothetical protein JWP91_3900 [Fibrobacteres bacterium]|nr:hypothetical protein [Fibrobacterota bacterium]
MAMSMKNPLILAWWLFLLTSLEVAALILDRFHHLEWGRIGLHLVKAGYLGFACVLFVRYLSFRSQKNFEMLVESYNRVAKKTFEAPKQRKGSWVNPFWNLVLVVLTSIDFSLVFQWNESVFKASVVLDFLIWMLLLRWLCRTYWLKSKGTRERLKEVLDDARSRMRDAIDPEPQVLEKRVSRFPFALLASLAVLVGVGVSFQRWTEVRDVFRVDDLKSCMDRCMRLAAVRFYHDGELQVGMEGERCVRERLGRVNMTLDLHQGELLLRAVESDSVDYFGNGKMGDEGLVLDAGGRFRKAWSTNFTEPE